MINLRNDYCGICHPKILEALFKYQDDTFVGYGLDEHTKNAENIIRNLIENQSAGVYFTITGTSTNKIMIDHALRRGEAVICCDTGHINVHETGAIESSGHKVLTVPNQFGKITISGIEKVIKEHIDFHMVKPKMVYISNATEYGTVYTKEELIAIRKICNQYNLYLFIDGARLGVSLTSNVCNYTLAEMASLCDAFYIGGNKNGLILGEALVITNPTLNENVRFTIKSNGGLLSKGFVNGIQFETLLSNNLMFDIAVKANQLAEVLSLKLQELGVPFLMKTETNQLFPIFDNEVIEKLKNYVLFETWESGPKTSVIRFVTHYKLTLDDINEVLEIIKNLLNK